MIVSFTIIYMLLHDIQASLRQLKPLGNRIMVKRAPKQSTKDANEGQVLAVGPGATLLSVGDDVLLPEYGGTKVKLGGDNDDDVVFLFQESDILGKFD